MSQKKCKYCGQYSEFDGICVNPNCGYGWNGNPK